MISQALNEQENLINICNALLIKDNLSNRIEFPQSTIFIAGLEDASGSVYRRLFAVLKIYFYLIKFRPRLVIDSSGSAKPLNILIWPIIKLFSKLYVIEHDPMPHQGHFSRKIELVRKSIRYNAQKVFVHGDNCRKDLVNNGYSKSQVVSINHGVMSYFQSDKQIIRKPHSVLFFGEMRPNKGVELLPDIVKLVHETNPKIEFTIAGSFTRLYESVLKSDWPAQLDVIKNKLENMTNVNVIDRYIHDDEVEEFFRSSEILLLPYKQATQSGVAMMGMAMGSIMIATNVGDIGSVVNDGITGKIADFSSESFSKAIIEIDNNEHLRNEIRINMDSIRTQFEWNSITTKILNS